MNVLKAFIDYLLRLFKGLIEKMHTPNFDGIAKQEAVSRYFAGINRLPSADEQELYSSKNLTSDYFPNLAPRQKRSRLIKLSSPNGLASKNGLAWVDGTQFFYNGQKIDGITLTDSEKQLVGMGGEIAIYPDKLVFNTETKEARSIDLDRRLEAAMHSGSCALFPCIVDGSYTQMGMTISFERGKHLICDGGENDIIFSLIPPETPSWGETSPRFYINPTDANRSINVINYVPTEDQYFEGGTTWQAVGWTTSSLEGGIYIKVPHQEGYKDIGEYLTVGSIYEIPVCFKGIFGPGIEMPDKNSGEVYWISEDKTEVVLKCKLYFEIDSGWIDGTMASTSPWFFKKTSESMDFVTEQDNRLWGCNSEKHEIYASKLGDPTSWNTYQGIASDSYAATIGSDGDFTGAYSFGGYVYFFKEDKIIKVYGNKPSNFTLKTINVPGVEKGSEKSIVRINERLYYKSPEGVMVFDGGIPSLISGPLGLEKYHNAVAGSVDGKLYISMANEQGEYSLFVYDTEKRTWLIEDDTEALFFACFGGDLFFINAADGYVTSVNGRDSLFDTSGEKEDVVSWEAESGYIGLNSVDKKVISKLAIRAEAEPRAEFKVFVKYDADKYYTEIFSHKSCDYPTPFDVPIIPKRHDSLKIKISGKGFVRVYSLVKYIRSTK